MGGGLGDLVTCVVPSGRQRVDTGQWHCLMPFLVLSVQWLAVRSFARQTINTVRCSQCRGDGSTQNRYYNGWAPPFLCLPSVYLMAPHVTRSPRPSPAVFAYCKYWWWWGSTGGGGEVLVVVGKCWWWWGSAGGGEEVLVVVGKCWWWRGRPGKLEQG